MTCTWNVLGHRRLNMGVLCGPCRAVLSRFTIPNHHSGLIRAKIHDLAISWATWLILRIQGEFSSMQSLTFGGFSPPRTAPTHPHAKFCPPAALLAPFWAVLGLGSRRRQRSRSILRPEGQLFAAFVAPDVLLPTSKHTELKTIH